MKDSKIEEYIEEFKKELMSEGMSKEDVDECAETEMRRKYREKTVRNVKQKKQVILI